MDKLYELNIISIFFRLLLASICGGILGIERERKNRPAGFRTYMLVCVTSAMVMLTNEYISSKYLTGDPSRMGAQVISGIGFLGAGTIIVTGKNRVRGLTTAAGLWASACIGLTIGVGFYLGAILGCTMIFVAMSLLYRVDNYIMSSIKEITLYIEFSELSNLAIFIEYIKNHKMKIIDMEIIKSNNKNELVIGGVFTIRPIEKSSSIDIIHILSKAEGVRFIEEI